MMEDAKWRTSKVGPLFLGFGPHLNAEKGFFKKEIKYSLVKFYIHYPFSHLPPVKIKNKKPPSSEIFKGV